MVLLEKVILMWCRQNVQIQLVEKINQEAWKMIREKRLEVSGVLLGILICHPEGSHCGLGHLLMLFHKDLILVENIGLGHLQNLGSKFPVS
uniref:Uncharacterized protein n=1 Tax=Arundo donax TaxID=35708 RepID=A0A0A9E5E8_ARUDO